MTVKKYRKKAVIVEALQYDGTNIQELEHFTGLKLDKHGTNLIIRTLEDGPQNQVDHYATVGDFIIKGVHDEFYPCNPDIFWKTYDVV